MLKSKTLTISINADSREIYEFVSNPENLPQWAKAFCKSIKKQSDKWIADTTNGPVGIRFVKRNGLGVLDQYVTVNGMELSVPMRVVANGDGSEVIFTLFKPKKMSEAAFAEDAGMVEKDLSNLKGVMEQGK